jgi:hypothetical protein
VIPWWLPTVFGSLMAASFAFWGWLAVKVIDQGRKIAEIEAIIKIRERECAARMDWLTRMDEKLSEVREGVAHIRGALENNGIERRKRD